MFQLALENQENNWPSQKITNYHCMLEVSLIKYSRRKAENFLSLGVFFANIADNEAERLSCRGHIGCCAP